MRHSINPLRWKELVSIIKDGASDIVRDLSMTLRSGRKKFHPLSNTTKTRSTSKQWTNARSDMDGRLYSPDVTLKTSKCWLPEEMKRPVQSHTLRVRNTRKEKPYRILVESSTYGLNNYKNWNNPHPVHPNTKSPRNGLSLADTIPFKWVASDQRMDW